MSNKSNIPSTTFVVEAESAVVSALVEARVHKMYNIIHIFPRVTL